MKSIRSMLSFLVGSGLVATCLLTGASMLGKHLEWKAVRQGMEAKDLTADILPPPLYVIELGLVLRMAVDGPRPVRRVESESVCLAKEYKERVSFWTAHPPHGLETHLMGAQHDATERLLAAAPAVLKAIAASDLASTQTPLKVTHAAQEISDCIAGSLQRVDAGVKQVAAAAVTMSDIVDQVQRITDLIGEIGNSAHEQTSGISLVSHAVTELDSVTQQNAALVEQSAAVAASLREQAAQLVQTLSIFKILQPARS